MNSMPTQKLVRQTRYIWYRTIEIGITVAAGFHWVALFTLVVVSCNLPCILPETTLIRGFIEASQIVPACRSLVALQDRLAHRPACPRHKHIYSGNGYYDASRIAHNHLFLYPTILESIYGCMGSGRCTACCKRLTRPPPLTTEAYEVKILQHAKYHPPFNSVPPIFSSSSFPGQDHAKGTHTTPRTFLPRTRFSSAQIPSTKYSKPSGPASHSICLILIKEHLTKTTFKHLPSLRSSCCQIRY